MPDGEAVALVILLTLDPTTNLLFARSAEASIFDAEIAPASIELAMIAPAFTSPLLTFDGFPLAYVSPVLTAPSASLDNIAM